MARGGARPGAGRKRGAKSSKTQEIALKAAEDGLTPIEVLLSAMRMAWDDAQNAIEREERVKMAKTAADIAKEAAPYVHPKMAPKAPDDDGKVINITLVGALTDGDNAQAPAATSGTA
ncbi:hypothetical protein [Petrachloros mirabilis]